jgi:hypothetical protein
MSNESAGINYFYSILTTAPTYRFAHFSGSGALLRIYVGALFSS